mgnify:CR=1 FL=1
MNTESVHLEKMPTTLLCTHYWTFRPWETKREVDKYGNGLTDGSCRRCGISKKFIASFGVPPDKVALDDMVNPKTAGYIPKGIDLVTWE